MEQTISVVVDGMTCGNCALTISKVLEKKGMTHIAANAASGEVSFTTPEHTDVDQVFDTIDSLGYKVQRHKPEEEAHQQHDHAHGDNAGNLLAVCILLTIPLLAHMFIGWHVLHMPLVQFVLATPVFIIGCIIFVPGAFRSLKHGVPNMNVLIMLGASAAYFYSLVGWLFIPEQAHEYLFFETAASIITLVMIGNWLEHKTVKSTTIAIDALVKLQPQKARLFMTDSIGKETILEVATTDVKMGDVVLVNHGDNIPIDGRIISGEANVDEHMITGESEAPKKVVGDSVVGGTIVVDGNLKIRATAVGDKSVLSNIVRMVREAQSVKPKLQKLADKISAIFVPAVFSIALLTIIINFFFVHLSFPAAMMRGIAVLVISCPCAMGLATPAAIAVGLGRAARNGILIKGGDTLELLKTIKQVVFDKTGTLTTGSLHINSCKAISISEQEFQAVVVGLEQRSSHPIAVSIMRQWGNIQSAELSDVKEIKGMGVQATDATGNLWQLGAKKWLAQTNNEEFDIYLYKNNVCVGGLVITDALRMDATITIQQLKAAGYKTILLSGDTPKKCEQVAAALGIDEVYAGYTPEQKNQKIDELVKISPTAMVGDGINDAPALARATVGISLSDASQIAIQSAQMIISNNQLITLPKAIRLGIYTEQTIKQNLFWAFIYNIIAIPFAASGFLTPTWGAGIMAMSDVVLIINSLRLGVRRL